jgi:Enoyl-(Acyl carrier protein) reductase
VQRRRPDHEEVARRQDHHGKLGCWHRTFRRWRLRPLWGSEGRYHHYTRYLAQDLGPFGITANCIAPGVIATGRIMATVIPGSVQSNRDRAELVALQRLGTAEGCAKVVEFLATDLSDYVTGVVIPIDGGLVRR